MTRTLLLIATILFPLVASSQTPLDSLAPDGGLISDVFAGGGSEAQTGGSFGVYNTCIRRCFPTGGFVEFGAILPGGRHGADGFFSVNHLSVFTVKPLSRLSPFATVGYSRLFVAGNAVNYGGGLIYRYGKSKFDTWPDFRVEYRDYYVPASGHTWAIRLGWGSTYNGPD